MAWGFATTSWARVLTARDSPSTEARQALEALCQTYWYPLYVFVRRHGYDADAARDLTQAYFAELLEKGHLRDYDPARGRFRVFLKASVKHFLSKEREKIQAWKRGGRTEVLSLDTADGEGRYRHEPADRLTPEEIFERRWALTVLERTLARLRRDQADAGRGKEFAALEGLLTGQDASRPYREIAAQLGISEGSIKTTVHRLRQRFGVMLREQIAETVAAPQDVDDEVKHLLGSIRPWNRPSS